MRVLDRGLTVIIGVGAASGTISVGTLVACYGFIIVLWATALRDRSLP